MSVHLSKFIGRKKRYDTCQLQILPLQQAKTDIKKKKKRKNGTKAKGASHIHIHTHIYIHIHIHTCICIYLTRIKAKVYLNRIIMHVY